MGVKAPSRCKPCKDGKHHDCEERFCHCHCMTPTVPYRGLATALPEPHRDLAHPLHLMRLNGLGCRTTRSFEVVYRPKPSTLEDHVRAVIQEYRFDLTRVLQTWTSPLPVNRPWWSHGHLAACFGCGRSCSSRDPLGQVRHPWCGWIDQFPEALKIGPAPMYPKFKQ